MIKNIRKLLFDDGKSKIIVYILMMIKKYNTIYQDIKQYCENDVIILIILIDFHEK